MMEKSGSCSNLLWYNSRTPADFVSNFICGKYFSWEGETIFYDLRLINYYLTESILICPYLDASFKNGALQRDASYHISLEIIKLATSLIIISL